MFVILTLLLVAPALWPQDSSDKTSERNREAQESSSHDTRVDISPPKGDAKNHPDSKGAVAGLEPANNPDGADVQEFHPWNPMKAMKDVEVGDFYFRRKNYRAAIDRYKDCLLYTSDAADE